MFWKYLVDIRSEPTNQHAAPVIQIHQLTHSQVVIILEPFTDNQLSPRSLPREGWPLLTVETNVNGDSRSTNERGRSSVGSLGSSYRCIRFLSCLIPVKNINFLRAHLFTFLVPIAQQTRQAVVLGRLSLSLWSLPRESYIHRDEIG
jgi:hypothetical protein